MHSVRVDDEVWRAALAKARSQGVTVTDVIVRALADYGRPVPPEPPPPEVVQEAIVTIERARKPRRPKAAAPVAAELARERSRDQLEDAGCPHPKSRVSKGLCGACGTGGL